MGFRQFKDVNQALLAKLAWFSLIKKDKPWVHMLLAKYYATTPFWTIKVRCSDSYVLGGILEMSWWLRKLALWREMEEALTLGQCLGSHRLIRKW